MRQPSKPLLCVIAVLTAAAVAPATARQGKTAQAAATVPAQKAVYRDGQKERFLLDGTWQFRADADNKGLGAHFERETSLSDWSPVTIPNAWNATDHSDESDRGSI